MYDDYDDVLDGPARRRASSSRTSRIDPDELRDYLGPFVEPAGAETFAFSRAWMREQFQRIRTRASPGRRWRSGSTCPRRTC